MKSSSITFRCLALFFPFLMPALLSAQTAPAPAPAAGDEATISPAELYRGQKGYGLSVFAGTEPQRFEVEVLGVLKNPNPGTSAILARLSGQGLEDSGVVAGMSGSPVYFDGRLAGAVAFSWDFAKNAIAGITPIEEMRQVAVGAAAPAGSRPVAVAEGLPVSLEELARGEFPPDLLDRQIRKLALQPAVSGADSAGLLWTLGGFGESSRQLISSPLVSAGGRVASAGSMGAAVGPDFDLGLSPGGAVAAVLVQGDLQLAASGTVTERRGDQVLAFGHPFLSIGPLNIPMAASEVITVISSASSSFKLSNLGPVVGAFQEDRQAAIFGRMGAEAPTIPLTIKIHGEGITEPRAFRMELADVHSLTPTLLAMCILGSIDTAGHSVGAQGLDFSARFQFKDYGDVVLRQSYDGRDAGVQSSLYLLSYASLMLQSPLEDVEVEGIEVEFTRQPEIRSRQILRAYTNRTEVAPGERIPVYLDLLAHGGATSRHSLEVTVPEDVPEGPYYLLITDGATGDAARLTLEPLTPTSFDEVLGFVRSLHPLSELQVFGLLPARGLVVGSAVMPQLPGSIRNERQAAAGGLGQALNLAIVQHQVENLGVPLAGAVRVDLKVRRR